MLRSRAPEEVEGGVTQERATSRVAALRRRSRSRLPFLGGQLAGLLHVGCYRMISWLPI